MKATRDDKCADCDLAVVILSKNAAGYIARAVDDALTIVGVAEVLVIDDASTDSTVAKVQAISDPRVRCLASPVAFGIGATLRRGVGQLSSPFVLVLPAEVTLTGDQLQRVVDPCRSGSCDVVRVGVVGGTRRSSGASSRLRRALGQLSRPGLRRLTVTLVTALSSHAFEHLALHSDGPIITSELDARLAATDWNVLYVDLGAVAVVGDPKGRRPSIGALLGSVRYTPGAEPLPEMRDLVAFSTADAELACALDDLDAAAPNYADWIAALVEPFLGRDVLEVGAGHGTMSSRLSRGVRRVVATDVSPRCAEFLRARFAGDALIEPFEGEVAAASGGRSFDSAVLINVLEHVPDQESVLREIFEALRPGGAVVPGQRLPHRREVHSRPGEAAETARFHLGERREGAQPARHRRGVSARRPRVRHRRFRFRKKHARA